MIIRGFLSDDAATLEVQYLLKELQNPTPKSPFAIINNTHHTELINLAEFFNIIPRVAEQSKTNRHNGRWYEVNVEPDQGGEQITHLYPTRQQHHQAPTPRVKTQKIKPAR